VHDAIPEDELRRLHKHFAIECNNRAWRLSEAPRRGDSEDREMLDAAHAAAFHWSKVGTELNMAGAAMLLGHVHALLGHGDVAVSYARSSFDFVTERESPAWEVAFAHAVLANASAAARDTVNHAAHYAQAKELGAALDDEERSYFDAMFRTIPSVVEE
jgi:hypothetical protein